MLKIVTPNRWHHYFVNPCTQMYQTFVTLSLFLSNTQNSCLSILSKLSGDYMLWETFAACLASDYNLSSIKVQFKFNSNSNSIQIQIQFKFNFQVQFSSSTFKFNFQVQSPNSISNLQVQSPSSISKFTFNSNLIQIQFKFKSNSIHIQCLQYAQCEHETISNWFLVVGCFLGDTSKVSTFSNN